MSRKRFFLVFGFVAVVAILVGLLWNPPDDPTAASPAKSGRQVFESRAPELPFSSAVRVGNAYYMAGKLGLDPATGRPVAGGAGAETRAIMDGFAALFQKLGIQFSDVVKGTVYLVDLKDYDALNKVYAAYFKSDPPARECVGVKELLRGARVEISFIAVKAE